MALSPSTTLLRTQTDERLVELARLGHERAFDAIVERYRRPLLRACRRFLPEARAEDALQHALLAAWSAIQRGDEVRDLRAWLYRIAHNTALNHLRKSGYDHDELVESARGFAEGPEEEVERRAVVRQTLAGLAALPERQREALLRMSIEGATQEEVARDLGLSEGAVRQLVFRARLTLRTAATAVTPLPLAGWLASGGLAGGAAAGGVGAAAAKFGAVAVIAGGAVAAPAVVLSDRGAERAAAVKRDVPRPSSDSTAISGPSSLAVAAAEARAVADEASREASSRRSRRAGKDSRGKRSADRRSTSQTDDGIGQDAATEGSRGSSSAGNGARRAGQQRRAKKAKPQKRSARPKPQKKSRQAPHRTPAAKDEPDSSKPKPVRSKPERTPEPTPTPTPTPAPASTPEPEGSGS